MDASGGGGETMTSSTSTTTSSSSSVISGESEHYLNGEGNKQHTEMEEETQTDSMNGLTTSGDELNELKDRLRMYEDPPPLNQINISVDGFNWHGQGLAKHCRYRISRTWKGNRLKVYRRFSDFVALHKKLLEEFPGYVIPAHPEKAFVTMGGEDTLIDRVDWFQSFLNSILRHPILNRSIWVRDFLFLATEDWQNKIDDSNSMYDVEEEYSKSSSSASAMGRNHPKELVSHYASNVSKMLGLDKNQGDPSHLGKLLENLPGWTTFASSSFLGKDSSSAANEAPAVATAAAVAAAAAKNSSKNGEWNNGCISVESRYVKLCWSNKPLQVCALPLAGSTQQNIQIKIDAQDGRLEAVTKVARTYLHLIRCIEKQSDAIDSLGQCMLEFGEQYVELQQLLTKFAQVMNETSKGNQHTTLQQLRKHSLQPILCSTLLMQGASNIFHKDQVKTKEQEKSMANDLHECNTQTLDAMVQSMESLAQIQIVQAQRNREKLQALITAFDIDPNELQQNRSRLGLDQNRRQWLWDMDTPM